MANQAAAAAGGGAEDPAAKRRRLEAAAAAAAGGNHAGLLQMAAAQQLAAAAGLRPPGAPLPGQPASTTAAPGSGGFAVPAPRPVAEDYTWVLPKRGVQQALKAAGLDKDFKIDVGHSPCLT
jgi:hypothetical protein